MVTNAFFLPHPLLIPALSLFLTMPLLLNFLAPLSSSWMVWLDSPPWTFVLVLVSNVSNSINYNFVGLHCCSFFHILRTTYCLERIVLAGDVELNPGPTGKLIIGSYNVRGCNSYQKTKRLGAWILKLKSCHRLVFSLQETHISAKNFSTARMLWREGLVLSPSLNNTRGVLTFYSTL